jgi:hypothetical protein
MKKLIYIFLIFLIPVKSPGAFNTDAIHLIQTPPAYNAVDGAFVEEIIITPCQCLGYSTIVTLFDNEIDIIPCQSLVFTSDVNLVESLNTNAIHLISTPPIYNAVNGAFVETLLVVPSQCLAHSTIVTLTALDIEIVRCQSIVHSTPMGDQRHFGRFRGWGNSRSWSGSRGVEFKSNNNLLMMSQ